MTIPVEPLILAVDLGTSGVKVALITLRGRVLAWQSVPVELHLTAAGGAEQVPEDWWRGFMTATQQLLARNAGAAAGIRAVCCSTQGEGTIPVDRDGAPLMNALLWMDMRGAPYLRSQSRGLVNIGGVAAHKLWRWIRLTGGMPSLSGKDPAGHMLLVREAFPQIYERTYKFLNVLDYMNLRLTGRFVATFDSILTSWVTDNRNPNDICYDPQLVRQSGIAADKFPEIVPCTALLGPLKPDVARTLGLQPDVQVVAGAIDNTAAAVGAGTVQDFATHLYIGTSSWMAAHVPSKKTDFGSYLASTPCAIPDRYLLTALQATAGGNLTFLRDNILYHEDELLREANVPDVFKIMDRMAQEVPAGSNGVIYTPWIWGERAPVEDRALRAGIYNLSLHNTRADIIRAVLEGVALNSRWLLGPFEKFIGQPLRQLSLVGGGGASDVWCQIFADVLNMEVRQPIDAIQTNARGAAFLAAVGLGEARFADLAEFVEFKRTYTPDPRNRAMYDERFTAFVTIYKQMRGLYQSLNRER